MKFTIYDQTTGKILRSGESNIEQELASGEAVLQGVIGDAATHVVSLTGEPAMIEKPALTLAELKESLIDEAAKRRWVIETGGVVWNGFQLATDDRSKLLVASAADRARRDANFTTKWKTDSGWVDLDADTSIAIYDAVFGHVVSSFQRESDLVGIINAAETSQAAEAIRGTIATFWPA
jgi:hypothetical protein